MWRASGKACPVLFHPGTTGTDAAQVILVPPNHLIVAVTKCVLQIPVLDHSALGWCLEVQQSGMRAAPFNPDSPEAQEADEETLASRPAYKPSKPLMVRP